MPLHRPLLVLVILASWVCSLALPSQASWLAKGAGPGLARSSSVGPGTTPTAVVSGRTVTLSWAASTLASGADVSGYLIRRYDAETTTQSGIDTGTCATSPVVQTTCTHTAAPAGSWRYTVTPAAGLWRGAESPSGDVAVAAPTLSLSASGLQPGGSLSGTASGFIEGELASYRLDSTTGTELAGTLAGVATPTAVPGSGGGDITVTIPAGTSDGPHLVYAVASTSGDSASYGVTVDGTAPAVPVLTSTPADPSGDSARFVYDETEAEATVECRLDAAAFAACTSPVDYTSLAPGAHTFQVRATDTVGNVSASASYPWTVDTTPPTIAITFPATDGRYNDASFTSACLTPAGGGICGDADSVTGVSAVAVSIRSQTTGLYWDGTGFASATESWLVPTGLAEWSYAIGASAFVSEGDYVVHARATNGGGGLSDDTRTFTIDRTAPESPTFDSIPASVSGPSVSLAFSTTDTAAGFQCMLDSYASTTCESPQAYTGLTDGAHTVSVRAVDAAGNTSAATTTSWTTDATAPTTSTTFPVAGSYHATGWAAGCGTPATEGVCGVAGDAGSGLAEVGVSLRQAATNLYWDGVGFSAISETFLTATGASSWSLPFAATSFPDDGGYTMRVRATDAVGNATFTSVDLTYDTVAPPVPVLTRTPDNPSGSTVDFAFTDSEGGVAFTCELDEALRSCTSPTDYSGVSSGPHNFSVQATDAAGNTSREVTYIWTVDLSLTASISSPLAGTCDVRPAQAGPCLSSVASTATWVRRSRPSLASRLLT